MTTIRRQHEEIPSPSRAAMQMDAPAPLDHSASGTLLDAPQSIPARTPAAIDLHIDEIALEGFSPAHRHLIGDAIERELTRLLASNRGLAALAQPAEIDALDGGTFRYGPGRKPAAVGEDVARAIYRRLAG